MYKVEKVFDVEGDALVRETETLSRIKSRAYKLLNTTVAAQNAELGLMCFYDRTGRRKKP